MLQTVPSAALLGLDVFRVRVEVAITRGTPLIQVIGLAESAVREGRERIRAAAAQLGLHVPGLRITVNLAPADVRKHGSAFDLPIIVGILAAAGQVPGERAGRYAMLGELGLNGDLRPVRGVLPIALQCATAADLDGLIVPFANLGEARPVRGLEVLGAESIGDVIEFLGSARRLATPADLGADESCGEPGQRADLADVLGQDRAKRALEIAAAGGHNLLFRGSPGSGKTMLARRLPSLLPPLTLEEQVEVTAVHSIAGRLPPAGLVTERPFRSPHHTISEAGLVGGGGIPRPGEVSLSHRGVLFLDELPEFRRRALDVLRQPLEEGDVHVVRARAAVRFPADFLLVAAMNPCPCGLQTVAAEVSACTCDPAAVRRYVGRVSGPLLDRIDLHVDVPAVRWRDLRATTRGEPSERVRARVRAARQFAADRQRPPSGRRIAAGTVKALCQLDGAGESMLRTAVERFRLSARAYHRILRVARTIADLAGEERVLAGHVAEAIQYRVPSG